MNRMMILVSIIALTYSSLKADIEKKIYETYKINYQIVIDGLMNEDVWDLVNWGGNFTQTRPYNGEDPSQRTAFKILYDDNNLYVFIRAFDTEPDKISTILSRRDNFTGDMVEINIDSNNDKQTAFSFTAMASGVKGEEAVSENGNRWDSSWDPVWYLKTSRDDEGWNAEMRIPFSQLRFAKKDEHVWGIQVMRHLFRKEERSHWQFMPKDAPGFVHLFGELHGVKNIKPRRQIDLLPYTVGKSQIFEKEPGNPFADGSLNNITAGLDGKIGITSDITLDFTLNPDFGQVEADPSVVNLTAFETYYREQRPFFVEGKNIYEFRPSDVIVINSFGRDNLFYSRRIGRAPQYYPDLNDEEYTDVPEATTILGAFKLTGKTEDGLSIGVLESITAEEKAEIAYFDQRGQQTVEPMTNYFVGRLQKDFNEGKTILGGMVTAVNRNITNEHLHFLHRAAYTGGFDFLHTWKDRTYYLGIKGILSHVQGDEAAIYRTQTSSARYFQRPDADHLSLDSTRTSLSGYGGTVKFGKKGSGRIRFESSLTLRSPGLELNDIGYMRNADMIHHGTWMGYYIREPFSIFRNFYLNLNYWLYGNFNRELLSKHLNMNFNNQFKNYWYSNGSITRNFESLSSTFLRGGPAFIAPGYWSLNFNLSSDSRKKFYYNFGHWVGLWDDNSRINTNYWCGFTFRPSNAVRLSVYPSYDHNIDKLQYVTQVDTEDDTRYIFAKINQKTLGFSLRLNYTLTPNLTIQFYGQPFISAAKYSNLKRITNPRAEKFADRFHTFTANEIEPNTDEEAYSIDENGDGETDYNFDFPDFNFRQFQSNLVIRWEYQPGSTLYLVWSQGRTGCVSNGDFTYYNNMKDLFSIHPHNVFLIKFNRLFSF